ncbi:bifunctional UDP-sugar hydrolase/5'-nucleotidase [Spirochaetia bacterium]|nr:bifunctional UDP-sugar hydrolase/5'-nucleotidase [Spirochaetia bacterium]GHU30042.1 bifunctional UDP-sugar hydrolase/5'-nucleotidase [Spirochaetia bacterium]
MNLKKIIFSVVAGLLLISTSFAGGITAGDIAARRYTEYELVVLHTNDHHGTTLAKDGKGGLAERATLVNAERRDHRNVLLLDAGDINTGSALSNMFDAEPDIKAYNLIGYDAVAFGNHEFDNDFSVLQTQMGQSQFTWLSANIKKADGTYLGKPYIVKDFGGFRVGIIGLTTLRSKVIASPDKSLTFIDEITAAKQTLADLKSKEHPDVIIIVGHIGDVLETDDQTTSPMIAEALSGVDLIVDGHSHSKFEEPLFVNGIPIVSANEWGKFVGKAILKIQNGKVTGFSWRPVEITATAFAPDPAVAALIKPYYDQAQASLKEVVMQTSAVFEFGNRLSRYREIALGDLCADATAAYVRSLGVDVDFAFHNGGNIRAELPAGAVTKEHILTVFPFDNMVYVVTLKGSDVIDLFNFIGSIRQGAGGWAQVSKEVRYTITYNEAGDGTISGVTINGQPIDPAKTYKIGTNDYLAGGGDGYIPLTKSIDTFNTSMLLNDIVIEYAKTLPQPVVPATDGRIQVIGGVEP